MIFCKNLTSPFYQTNFSLNQRKDCVTIHKQIRYLLKYFAMGPYAGYLFVWFFLRHQCAPMVSESWQTWLCIIMMHNRDQKRVWSVGSLRSQTSLAPGQCIHCQTFLLFPGLLDHIFVLLLQKNNARLLHDWTVKRDCVVTSLSSLS